MQILEGSVIYGVLKKLSWCYKYSFLKKFFSGVAVCCKNSFIARRFHASGKRRNFSQNSVFLCGIRRLFKGLYKWTDKVVLNLSGLLHKWSEGSLLCCLFRFLGKASGERLFVMVLPVFGVGYIVGRLLLNRLMKRDILFLAVTFLVAALFANPEKLKLYFKNSLFYKLYMLVLR